MPASHNTEQQQMEVDSDKLNATLPPTLPYGPEGTLLEDTLPDACGLILRCELCGRCSNSYVQLTQHMRIRHKIIHIRDNMFEQIIPIWMTRSH
jgi:hypothetical protein